MIGPAWLAAGFCFGVAVVLGVQWWQERRPRTRWVSPPKPKRPPGMPGDEGHAFDLPTVRVRAGGSLRRARRTARKALHDAGYHGFTVSERRLYQRGRRPWSAYVEVEMWGRA